MKKTHIRRHRVAYHGELAYNPTLCGKFGVQPFWYIWEYVIEGSDFRMHSNFCRNCVKCVTPLDELAGTEL